MKRFVLTLLFVTVFINSIFCTSLSSTLQLNKGVSKTVVNIVKTNEIDLTAKFGAKSHIKGDIGEALTDMDYFERLNYSGSWAQVNPRIKSQGLDHLYLEFDAETGLPKSCLIGDTKYGSSNLKIEKDGLIQMSKEWRQRGLQPVIEQYEEIHQKCISGDYIRQKPIEGIEVEKYPVSQKSYFYKYKDSSQLFFCDEGDITEVETKIKVVKDYLRAIYEDRITSRNVIVHITLETQPDGKACFVQQVNKFNDVTNKEIPGPKHIIEGNAIRRVLSENSEISDRIKNTFSLSDQQMKYLQKTASDEDIIQLLNYKEGSPIPAKVKEIQRRSFIDGYAKHTIISVAIADVIDVGSQFISNGYSFDNFDFTELLKTSGRAVVITAVYEVKNQASKAITSRVRKKIIQSAVGSIDKPTVELVTASIDAILDFTAGYAIDTADIQIKKGKGLITTTVAKKMQERAVLVNGVPSVAQIALSIIPFVGPWIGQAANSALSVIMEFIVPNYDELSISVLNTMMEEDANIIDKWIVEHFDTP